MCVMPKITFSALLTPTMHDFVPPVISKSIFSLILIPERRLVDGGTMTDLSGWPVDDVTLSQ